MRIYFMTANSADLWSVGLLRKIAQTTGYKPGIPPDLEAINFYNKGSILTASIYVKMPPAMNWFAGELSHFWPGWALVSVATQLPNL